MWPSRAGLSAGKQSQGGEQAVMDKHTPGTLELEKSTASGPSDYMQMYLAGECPSKDVTHMMPLLGFNEMP